MAETAGDVMIRITANGSQTRDEMAKIKSEVEQTTKEVDKKVNDGVKKSSDKVKKGAEDAADGVEQGTKKIGDDVRKTTDDVKKGAEESSQSSKKMGDSFQKAGNRISEAGKKIKKALKTEAALAFAVVGAAALNFAKQCIDSAIKSESAWKRFGAIVDQQGGDWSKQEKDVKGWARTFSNNMGYAVSDTREASLNLLQFGVDAKNLEPAMRGVAGLAARTGMSEAEASKVVISAMAGRGTQLKKLTGLSVDAYNKCQTEADQLRLLSDLYKQNEIALREHGETTEAQLTRVDNSWGRLKVEVGQSLMPVIKLMADVLWVVAEAFSGLPDPVKQFISALLLIGGAISVVIGTAGMLAPGLIAIGEAIGGVSGAIAFLTGPIGIAIAAIIAFVGIMYYLYTTNEDVRNALNGFADWLKSSFASAWTSLQPVIQGLGQWLSEVGSAVGSVVGPAFNELVTVVQPVGEVFGELVSALQEWWMAVTGTDTSGATTGFNTLATVGNALKEVIVILARFFMTEFRVALTLVLIPIKAVVMAFTSIIKIATQVIQTFQTLFAFFNGDIGLVEFAHKIYDSFMSVFGGTLFGIVVDEMANIANAFLNVDGILSAIEQGFNQVVDWFKSVLGIASPGRMAQLMSEEMGHIANAITNGVMGVLTAIGMFVMSIVQRFMQTVSGVRMVFSMVVNAIRTRLNQARASATMIAQMIRQAIVTRFTQIIVKVRTIFSQIVSTIRSRLSSAASNARSKALEIYNGIKNKVSSIPDMVKQEFDKIKDKIKSALDSARQVAVTKISELVSAVKSALGIASPGFVQRMITYEFFSLPNIINTAGDSAIDSASRVATGIVQTWDDNMQSLGVQFDAFNPFNVGMTVSGASVGGIEAVGRNMRTVGDSFAQNTQYTNSVNNDNNTVIYNIDEVTFDTNTLDLNGKQMFYDVLNEISRQGV